MAPDVFGPPLWFSLHVMASNYPQQPERDRRAHCEAFLRALPSMLPCVVCGEHLQEALAGADVAAACAGREPLAQLFCRVHNEVNVRTGKPAYDCGGVLQAYEESPLCRPVGFVSDPVREGKSCRG